MTVIAGHPGLARARWQTSCSVYSRPARARRALTACPLAGANLHRWRRSVACVPQDPHLFHDTIRTNLRWAQPGATDVEMWQALRLAAADGFVTAPPDGAGHRHQQPGRAALRRRAPADRPGAGADEKPGHARARRSNGSTRRGERAADPQSAESLRGHTTIVAITHRPALPEAADGIVRLKSGRVTGPPVPRQVASPSSSTRPAS